MENYTNSEWLLELNQNQEEYKSNMETNKVKVNELNQKIKFLESVKSEMEKEGKDTFLLQSRFIDLHQSETDQLRSQNEEYRELIKTIESITENLS